MWNKSVGQFHVANHSASLKMLSYNGEQHLWDDNEYRKLQEEGAEGLGIPTRKKSAHSCKNEQNFYEIIDKNAGLEFVSYACHDNMSVAKDSRLVFVFTGNEPVAV